MSNHYECRKCGHRFNHPEIVTVNFMDGNKGTVQVCPLCKIKDFVPMLCAYCDCYKSRIMPCELGHQTIVPFNISCWEWKIRSKDKPKVI